MLEKYLRAFINMCNLARMGCILETRSRKTTSTCSGTTILIHSGRQKRQPIVSETTGRNGSNSQKRGTSPMTLLLNRSDRLHFMNLCSPFLMCLNKRIPFSQLRNSFWQVTVVFGKDGLLRMLLG